MKVERNFCIKCKALMLNYPGVGPFCPNLNCDNGDGPAIVVIDEVRDYK